MQHKRLVRRFAKDQQGGVTIITAAAMTLLLVLIGGFLDFGLATIARSQVHGAMDAAALAAAAAPDGVDRQAVARRYYTANYVAGIAGSKDADVSDLAISINNNTVSVSNSGHVDTGFLQLAQIDEISIGKTTVVGIESLIAMAQDVDVALVLDGTGSMEGITLSGIERRQAVKDASLMLTDMLQPVPNPPAEPHNPNIRLGLVEYFSAVRQKERLTSVRNEIIASINQLSADGVTCGACGLRGAIELFSNNPPPNPSPPRTNPDAPPPAIPGYSPVKVVILLTDGEFNTLEKTLIRHTAKARAQAAARCEELKDMGVNIYTIGFGKDVAQPGNPVQETLHDCATAPDQFFLTPDAPDLMDAFTTIFKSINKIRITQ